MKLRGFWVLPVALLAVGLPVAAQPTISASPGVVNYVEGQASIDGRTISRRSVGTVALRQDQVLTTEDGKTEILLTPGAFLRAGDHSSIRMVSPSLTDTRVELLRGEALVEVTQLFKGNQIRIIDKGTSTELLKHGLYQFTVNPPEARVYDGKAAVYGDDGTRVTLGKGHQTSLAGFLHAQNFDRKQQDTLYRWSSVRSEYLADASLGAARTIVVNGNPWWGPGWYWNPWWSMYSFIPGDGFLYSPFGWGFYSPGFVYMAPPRYYRVPHGAIVPPPGRIVRPAPGVNRGFGPPAVRRGGFGGGAARGSMGGRRR